MGAKARQQRFKKRLAKLIEISNEMVLNAADGEFLRAGTADRPRQIFYVFDETVFEFFVNPDEVRRKYPAFFHLEEWRDDSQIEDQYWILVNEMLSILTAEYLFSGKLPGQGDKRLLYMTFGHRFELGRSYASLVGGAQPKSESAAADSLRALARALKRISDIPADEDTADRLLEPDLRGVPEKDRESFLRVRRLARTFAFEKDHLILAQLRRLSREIWPLVHDVTYQFPLTRVDRDIVDEETKGWEKRLSEENRKRPRSERTEHGLRRDARALAMLQHIARYHLDEGERLVFVTGDRLMLDCYWFWYSEMFVRRPWEPNIVRSVGRFSPIVNVNDMWLEPERREPAAFELMQVAIGLAIQPWNLKAHEKLINIDPQPIANLWDLRRRILDSIHDPGVFPAWLFDSGVADDKVGSINLEFDKIRDLFQVFERAASRVGLELMERRRNELLDLHPGVQEPAGDEASAMAYFRDLMEDLVKENAKVWLPIVVSFLGSGDAIRLNPDFQPPILLLTVGPGRDGDAPPENVGDFEKRLGKVSRDELGYLMDSPHLIFVLGALFALRADRWTDANLYTSLAKTAYRTLKAAGVDAATEEPDYQEIRYLRAVCARMMIGSLPKRQNDGSDPGQAREHDIWEEYLLQAQRNLESCLAVHRRRGQTIRTARALSERCTVRLWYAVWRFVDPPRSPDPHRPSLANRLFEVLTEDLMPAFRLVFLDHAPPADQDMRIMWLNVRRQIISDVVAVDGLSIRMRDLAGHWQTLQDLIAPAVAAAEVWLPQEPANAFSQVVRHEAVDFLARRSLLVPEEWRSPNTPTLAIDREILQILARPVP